MIAALIVLTLALAPVDPFTCSAAEEARYQRLGYDEDCSADKAAELEAALAGEAP